MPVGTKFTATYVGMVVECYGVHITVCIALLVCTLSASAFIEPSQYQLYRFLLEIFLWIISSNEKVSILSTSVPLLLMHGWLCRMYNHIV